MKLISIKLKSNFAFFKKPDINDSIYLTYNMIHKPAILGILGAILGYSGHSEYGILPEYYEKLRHIKIGIQPIGNGQKNGNFEKTTVKYNNSTGFANANDYGGATLNILEQILIQPEYRIYFHIDENEEYSDDLRRKLEYGESSFIPYFGKNDFPCWWENFQNHDTSEIASYSFKIISIFRKPVGKLLKDLKKEMAFGLIASMKADGTPSFTQFERLPTGFNETLMQYSELSEFIYTNIKFSKSKFKPSKDFKQIRGTEDVVYLF